MVRFKLFTESFGTQSNCYYIAEVIKTSPGDKKWLGTRWSLGDGSVDDRFFYECTLMDMSFPQKVYEVCLTRQVGNWWNPFVFCDGYITEKKDDDIDDDDADDDIDDEDSDEEE